jgi:hypothetical protein
MRTFVIAIVLLLLAIPASATAIQYSSKDEFLAALQTPYFFEDFDQFTYGGFISPSLELEKENYLVVLSAANRLFSGNGNMSVDCAKDHLIIDFSGSLTGNYTPITAVGANFWPADFYGNSVVGPVRVTLSDGSVYESDTASSGTFVGFTSTDGLAFQRLEFAIPTELCTSCYWPTIDNLYVGSAIGGADTPIPNPEPSSMLLLGSGICGIAVEIRNKKRQ